MNFLKKLFNQRLERLKRFYYKKNLERHLTRLRSTKISNPASIYLKPSNYKEDGGCSQILRQLSIIAFTKAYNFSYIHSPFNYVMHNADDDPDWETYWDRYLNLSNFETSIDSAEKNFRHVENFNTLISEITENSKSTGKQFYRVNDCFPIIYKYPEIFHLIQEDLRHSYRSTQREKNLVYNSETFNVAIHIRRGDVTKNRHQKRYTPATKLVQVVSNLKRQLGDIDFQIYGFCVEFDDDLAQLESEGVKIIHEFDIFQVMDHLIHSNLMIMSKSTISYVTAILNDGIIIHEPFLYPPLDEWLHIENFERDLKYRLSKHLTEA